MSKGILIVMEGACDGIGKSTQYELLYNKLVSMGYDVVKHHFPSYNTFHGAPVEKYLAGELGKIEDLSPYFINSLYATDRACAWYLKLKKDYDDGKIILLDRYTTSSIIYQSSVIKTKKDRMAFIDYVCDYEYQKLKIAVPDMVIFLEAPFDIVNELRKNRTNYEGNSNDIHEKDLKFMKKVYTNSITIADYLKWDKIICNSGNKMKTPEAIHRDILNRVIEKIKNAQ